MKKFLLQLFIIIFTIIGASVFGLQAYRYHINSPMADIEYKKAILRDSHNLTFTLEALRPIMGKEELAQFITANDNNPGTYTPDDINIKSGKFRANLHTHTDNSDGITTVEQRMNEA